MIRPTTQRLDDIIEWQFAVSEQHNMSRYGTYDGRYWKQFMSGGVINSALHPPKTIYKAHYDRALEHTKF